jgi:hypothetical protein
MALQVAELSLELIEALRPLVPRIKWYSSRLDEPTCDLDSVQIGNMHCLPLACSGREAGHHSLTGKAHAQLGARKRLRERALGGGGLAAHSAREPVLPGELK